MSKAEQDPTVIREGEPETYVTDIDKAREMAEAEHPHRENFITLGRMSVESVNREIAEQLKGDDPRGEDPHSLNRIIGEETQAIVDAKIRSLDSAVRAGEVAGERYDTRKTAVQ